MGAAPLANTFELLLFHVLLGRSRREEEGGRSSVIFSAKGQPTVYDNIISAVAFFDAEKAKAKNALSSMIDPTQVNLVC